MVICMVPIRLWGDMAGEYERGVLYPDDRLAQEYPDYFVPADPVEAPKKKKGE